MPAATFVKHSVLAIGSTVAGATLGMITGVCGSVAYVFTRAANHVSGSIPQTTVNISSTVHSLQDALECLPEGLEHCVSASPTTNWDPFAVPISRGAIIMTGVGAAFGLAAYTIHAYRAHKNRIWITLGTGDGVDGDEVDDGLDEDADARLRQNGQRVLV